MGEPTIEGAPPLTLTMEPHDSPDFMRSLFSLLSISSPASAHVVSRRRGLPDGWVTFATHPKFNRSALLCAPLPLLFGADTVHLVVDDLPRLGIGLADTHVLGMREVLQLNAGLFPQVVVRHDRPHQ
jgi:hypothetical protein